MIERCTFENDKLVKIDGVRPEYMDGHKLIQLVRDLAVALNETHTVLGDLMTWFPAKPSEPQWQLKAGTYGADDAIEAARKLVKTDETELG